MTKKDNCEKFGQKEEERWRCPYLRTPVVHSGFTGKSGEETWWRCVRHKKAVRNVRKCDIAGDGQLQRDTHNDDRSL